MISRVVSGLQFCEFTLYIRDTNDLEQRAEKPREMDGNDLEKKKFWLRTNTKVGLGILKGKERKQKKGLADE